MTTGLIITLLRWRVGFWHRVLRAVERRQDRAYDCLCEWEAQ